MSWDRVTGFHMDEYVGIGADHPASFARYMRDRIVARVHRDRDFHLIDGRAPPERGVRALRRAARRRTRSTCASSGSARTVTSRSTIRPSPTSPTRCRSRSSTLDDACRRQQVGEGHFPDVDARPRDRDHGDDPGAASRPPGASSSRPTRARRRRCAAAFTGPVDHRVSGVDPPDARRTPPCTSIPRRRPAPRIAVSVDPAYARARELRGRRVHRLAGSSAAGSRSSSSGCSASASGIAATRPRRPRPQPVRRAAPGPRRAHRTELRRRRGARSASSCCCSGSRCGSGPGVGTVINTLSVGLHHQRRARRCSPHPTRSPGGGCCCSAGSS